MIGRTNDGRTNDGRTNDGRTNDSAPHTLTPRENRESVRNILKSLYKTQYLMNTLYIDKKQIQV